ncbi:MAG: alkaline phosphatase [Candidatus Thorarchaeota archaeon]
MTNSSTANRLSIVLVVASLLVMSAPIAFVSSTNHEIASESNGLSIILMIGDGMGLEQVKLGRWVEVGPEGNLTIDTFPYNWSVTTHSADAAITDSAAAATAIATGVKTNNYMVGQSPDGTNLDTVLEIAESLGKSTGLVSTTSYFHATPAGFYANAASRNDYATITQQLVDEHDVEVILSGGLSQFTGGQLTTMQSNGYALVQNRTELEAVSSGRILGMFNTGYYPDEPIRDLAVVPSIAEMTNKSLEILSQDADGFFLMVEGGQIDWSSHDNDKVGTALETIAFDKAINISLQYVQEHSNTILLVTADHETGGLAVISNTLSQELPSDSDAEADNRNLRMERANNVTTTWTTTGHTATPVPLFMYGDALIAFPATYSIDNIDIFVIMDTYFSGGTLNSTIFETTSTTTTTQSSTTTTEPSSSTTTETSSSTTTEPSSSTTTETSSSTTEPTSTSPPPSPPSMEATILLAIGAAAVVIVVLILLRKR